jgi:hypothetical protein
MNPIVAVLIDLGLQQAKQLLESLTKAKAPVDVINDVQAAVDALQLHWNDDVTKAALESLRGVAVPSATPEPPHTPPAPITGVTQATKGDTFNVS